MKPILKDSEPTEKPRPTPTPNLIPPDPWDRCFETLPANLLAKHSRRLVATAKARKAQGIQHMGKMQPEITNGPPRTEPTEPSL